jgi:AMMECR1 domain-containing protein
MKRKIVFIGIIICIFISYSILGMCSNNIITYEDKQKLINYAYFVLDSSFGKESNFIQDISQIGSYNKLFITLMSNKKIRACQSGKTDRSNLERTKLDIEEAVVKCISDKRFGGVLSEDELTDTKIIFTIVFNRDQICGDLDDLAEKIELGIHAIEIENGDKKAYFEESVPITKNYSLEETLERLCEKAELGENCYTDPKTKIFIYNTITFKGDREDRIVDLHRYNILINSDEIDSKLLFERIALAKTWFINNINNRTERLQYMYYPSSDKYSSSNNYVRQLATLWSITKLKDFFQDSSFDNLIEETLNYYLDYSVCIEDYSFIMISNEAKLAYNAFLILSLLHVHDYPDNNKLLTLLGKGIISLQNIDGSFNTYFVSDRNTGVDYYPGEAMLALIKLYNKTRERTYLDAVYKAFYYYRQYWRNNKNTAFIPWHSQIYFLLYNEIKDPQIKDFVFEMNDWLINNYQIYSDAYIDEIGGFPKSNPRNSTSSYLEGIADACLLARNIDDNFHLIKYRDAIRLGVRFILLTQYTEDNAFYIRNQKRALGGFRHSLISNTQRIDYTQHAIMALMKIYNNRILD